MSSLFLDINSTTFLKFFLIVEKEISLKSLLSISVNELARIIKKENFIN